MSDNDDRVRQQDEIDAETTASTQAMVRAIGAARDRSLDRRETELNLRQQRLDDREAELDRRDVVQREWQVQADRRDQQADQREINAQTAWPPDATRRDSVG